MWMLQTFSIFLFSSLAFCFFVVVSTSVVETGSYVSQDDFVVVHCVVRVPCTPDPPASIYRTGIISKRHKAWNWTTCPVLGNDLDILEEQINYLNIQQNSIREMYNI